MLLDDFFIRAIVVGIGIAIIAGPFGCFVVWCFGGCWVVSVVVVGLCC